ncbi:nonribosomal peptide synthase GliP [Colletotrichum asianum]
MISLNTTLCEILHTTSDEYGNHVAIDHEDGVLTYSELQHYSTAFARKLRDAGVKQGDRVPLLTAHGTRNIVALMGILITGAIYVPMDADTWSEERIQAVLAIADGNVMVNTGSSDIQREDYRVVHLRDLKDLEYSSDGFKQSYISPSSLACIIFTSGSTGKPKGVMIPHEAIVNYATTSPFNMDVRCGDRVLHILSVSFDASTGMLFSILRGAGTIVPANKLNLITKAKSCSIIACTPSILTTLPPPALEDCQYPTLRTVLLGGEVIPQELIDAWCVNGRRILNAYGPTETTCASLMHVIDSSVNRTHESNAIIGKPMPNAPVHLLDSDMRELRECGQEGEIVISGPGVARGYFRDEEKTKKSFIERNGRRMYRTGDYGMWTTDGLGELVIEFRGRRDRVVKNRGFLVNLDADIETPMASMDFGIQSIHVTQFGKKIIALVCPESVDTDRLRQVMLETFSTFMVPDRILSVPALPMTPNGKVDPKGVLKMLEESHDVMLTKDTILEVTTQGSEVWLAVKECARRSLSLGNNVVLRPSSNLFSLGASSLDILMFVSLCQSRGCRISVPDVYSAETLEDLCGCIGAVPVVSQVNETVESEIEASSTQGKIHSEGLNGHHNESQGNGCVDAHPPKCAPMTPLQLELAQPTLAEDGKNTNRICIRYAIEHADRMEQAWHKVWTTEPVSRTKFSLVEGSGGTQIVEDCPLTLPIKTKLTDYRSFQKAINGVSLKVGLGTRLDFLQFLPDGDDDHPAELAVVWTVHHCLVDGYAVASILARVENIAVEANVEYTTDPFTVVARRLVEKQRKQDSQAKEFWLAYLHDAPFIESLGLPRPNGNRTDVAEEIRFSSAIAFSDLRKLASESHVTVATCIYTAWAMVISKYTNQDTVTIGAVVSGRDSPLISQTAIGPLINTLPLVVRLKPEFTVKQALRRTLHNIAEVTPFAWSTPQQINHRTSSVVALQYDYPKYPGTIPQLGVDSFENTAFPLNLLVERNGTFRLVYDPAVYGGSWAQDMADYFQLVLTSIVGSQGITPSIPPAIPSKVETLIMRHWNPVSDGLHDFGTLQEAFEGSCRKHGDLPAVECNGESLTYRQLNALASQVCLRIRAAFTSTSPIAIHADGSLNWIVGILGILKAGRTYCPLDPQYPIARRAAVCTAAGVAAVVFPSATDVCGNVPLANLPILAVSEVIQKNHLPVQPSCFREDPDSDALIVFTSGTTGTPKGVPISHRGLLALQSNPEATMFSRPGKRIAQMMSPAFDYCANEIFSALLHGASLVLRDSADPYAHLSIVDSATLTPSLMAALDPDTYPSLRTVYATGEPVTPGLVQRWAPGRCFYNAYGPAEGSICVSFTKLVPGEEITIGRAIRTARMYILDRNFEHQPIGALGELFLAGVQVTRGYLNADEQTKLRYMPDPWHSGERMYRTGDFCRWTRDGQVSYVGRLDRQIKIRGFRVELPTVEQHIQASNPEVILVSVLAIEDTLVSVIKPACVNTKRIKLPPSWVPQRFVATDDFPLTPNKKIDMVALKKMLDHSDVAASPVKGETMQGYLAEAIAREWRSLLKIQDERPLQALDSFTALGGHSILQMLLSVRLSSRFGVRVSLRDVLQADALRDLVSLVRTRQFVDTNEDQLKSIPSQLAPDSLSRVEQYMCSEYKMASRTSMFNIPLVLKLEGSFSRAALASALNKVLSEHEIFRSNYTEVSCRPLRTLRSNSPRVREQAVLDLDQEINHNFRVCEDELIRIHLLDDRLVVVVSHMIADLTSLQNFFQDVSAVYKTAMAPSPSSIRDYISLPRWKQPVGPEDREFWQRYLQGAQHHVPLGRPSATSRYDGQSDVFNIPQTLVKSLVHMMRSQSITRHQLALAAVALTLRRVTLEDDLVVGSPCSCRFSASEQRAMGLLLDRLPIRIGKIREGTSCAAFLGQVREASQAALARVIPFPELLRILGINQDFERHPLFEVMVTFHLDKGPQEHLEIPNCSVSAFPVHASGSKFLLMFEWTECSEGDWMLRIEYNSQRISRPVLTQIKQSLFDILNDLSMENDIV